jgi:hypothetical protein
VTTTEGEDMWMSLINTLLDETVRKVMAYKKEGLVRLEYIKLNSPGEFSTT